MIKKLLYMLCAFTMAASLNITCEATNFFEGDDNIIIVIDPGHGGENLGTDANPNFVEKDINLKTANALIAELSKYEGVTVYTTRTEDVDLSLKERAEFAESVEADFLFSLHYNASENHTLYGAEVWIPLSAPYHAPAYQFAYLQLQEMEEMGLFIRGIKTRLGSTGKDYYGIIREATARDIPTVIIEHCHVDEERDSAFVGKDEMYEEFGRRDAQAIATFLHLEGAPGEIPEHLNNLTLETTIPDTYSDDCGADFCHISVDNADYENGTLTLTVTGTDYNLPLLYYDYSIDGGKTYSKRTAWPGSNALTGAYDESFSLMLEIPENTKPRVIIRAYNKFELLKDSNILTDFDTFRPAEVSDEERYAFLSVYESLDTEQITKDNDNSQEDGPYLFGAPFTFKRFVLLFGFSLFWVFLLVLWVRLLFIQTKKA